MFWCLECVEFWYPPYAQSSSHVHLLVAVCLFPKGHPNFKANIVMSCPYLPCVLDHRIPWIIRPCLPYFLTFMFFGMLTNLGYSKIIQIWFSLSTAKCPYAWLPVLLAVVELCVFKQNSHHIIVTMMQRKHCANRLVRFLPSTVPGR